MTEQLLEKEAVDPRTGGGLRGEMRPYLPDRQTVRVLTDGLLAGSKVLISRGWERVWLSAEDWRDGLTRLGYAAGGVYVAVYALRTPAAAPVAPFVGPVLAGAWCTACWVVAPTARKSRRSAVPAPAGPVVDEDQDDDELDDDEELEAAGESHSPVPTVDGVAALVREVAARNGHQGAHLDDLIATGGLGGWDKTALRSALDEWDIEVAEFKLRFAGRQRVRMGVRLRDLPAGLGEGPAGGAPEDPAGTPAEGALPAPAGAPVGRPVAGAVEASPAPPEGPSIGRR